MITDVMVPSTVPCGKLGEWEVDHYTVTEEEAAFFNLRSAFTAGHGRRSVIPGTYTRLLHNIHVIMSDTPAEMRDHAFFVHRATGQVLVTGLGLGVVVDSLLRSGSQVEHVTVIERSPSVIALVEPHLQSLHPGKLTVIGADALEYQPERGQYDCIWHDIWTYISGDNWEDMKRMRRRYRRGLKPGGWQQFWCEEEVKWHNKNNR